MYCEYAGHSVLRGCGFVYVSTFTDDVRVWGGTKNSIEACEAYKGAVLLVSHDQYFLSKVATEYWGVVGGKLHISNDLAEAKKTTYG